MCSAKYPLAYPGGARDGSCAACPRSKASRPYAMWRRKALGYGDIGIKQAIEEGYIPGPRIVSWCARDSTTGGYPLEGYAPDDRSSKRCAVDRWSVERGRLRASQLEHGADWIKVYMTHRS